MKGQKPERGRSQGRGARHERSAAKRTPSQEVRNHPSQQDTQPTITPEIALLAARIAEPISKAHAKNILVIDLRGPELQSHPLGSWLANQLAAALRRDFPMLQSLTGLKLQ